MSDSEDSGPKDRNPPKKDKKRAKLSSPDPVEKGTKAKDEKGKKDKKDPAAKRKKEESDEDDDDVGGKIPLGSKKFISISEFRGKKLVDVREWYGDDDDLKPGKKGISLSKDQFEKLVSYAPKILKKMDED